MFPVELPDIYLSHVTSWLQPPKCVETSGTLPMGQVYVATEVDLWNDIRGYRYSAVTIALLSHKTSTKRATRFPCTRQKSLWRCHRAQAEQTFHISQRFCRFCSKNEDRGSPTLNSVSPKLLPLNQVCKKSHCFLPCVFSTDQIASNNVDWTREKLWIKNIIRVFESTWWLVSLF